MSRRLKTTLIALAAGFAATAAAAAQDTPIGERYKWYVSGMGGVNWVRDQTVTVTDAAGTPPGFPIALEFDTGWAAGGAIGFFLPKAFRIEVEGAYRANDFDSGLGPFDLIVDDEPVSITFPISGDLTQWSVLLNIVKDFPTKSRITPYIGGGAGVGHPKLTGEICAVPPLPPGCETLISADDTSFAFQAIAGLSIDLGERLQLFVDYRYFGVLMTQFIDGTNDVAIRDLRDRKQTVMGGLRYAFGERAAPVVVAPQPKNYLVFFDHDRSNLTADGAQVVATAAKDAIDGKAVSLDVTGHADRSGSDAYNMGLSERRANTVKGELVRLGVPDSAIRISWKGESEPLVATADGVREPQNRRASITINFGQ